MAHAEVHRRQPTIPKASSAYFMRPHVSCLACLDAAGSEYYNSLCTALRCGTCAIGRCPSGVHLAIGLHFRGLSEVLQLAWQQLDTMWTHIMDLGAVGCRRAVAAMPMPLGDTCGDIGVEHCNGMRNLWSQMSKRDQLPTSLT